MAWRERLLSASFRGVPFFVERSEYEGGRKVVAFDYPQRDTPFVEDLGRRGRIFPTDAYVIGDDYFTDRDALTSALEQAGPGTLIHPYHGSRLVIPGVFRISETVEEGRMARFSIEFLETEAKPFSPSIVSAPGARVGVSSARALTAVQNAFTKAYSLQLPPPVSTKKAPGFTFDKLVTLVTDFSGSLRKYLAPVVRGTQELASLKRKLDAIITSAQSLVRDPFAMSARFRDAFVALLQWPATPRLGLKALLSAYGFTSSAIRPLATTPSHQREQANFDVTRAYLQRMTLVQAVQLASAAATFPRITISTAGEASDVQAPAGYDSYEDAAAVRDSLLVRIDEQAIAAADDEL
jgi:prophage DNA circulation protein